MSECDDKDSPCHKSDLPRLNRIGGQIAGVKKMIEEHRYCPEILTQLRAIRAAIKGLEANILERHLGHCVQDGLNAGNMDDVKTKINELKEIFKRYDD
jgi:CsoR family transcriptional regulator, copper-sensing transcriptional repressor